MNKQKLKDFGGNKQLAAEYSDIKDCSLSDSGYHCSCFDDGMTVSGSRECCICGKVNNEKT